MIVCPWCGTNFATFQPNCRNCGGPLHVPAPGEDLPAPPPPPRPISNRYAWQLMWADGSTITGLILGFMGVVFLPIGGGILLGDGTVCVGLPFALIGLALVAAAVLVLARHIPQALKVVQVLREGATTVGAICDVRSDPTLEINGRHPWIIEYEYELNGQTYRGKVSTMNRPGQGMEVGKPARVLYLPGEAQVSSIYPHP